MYAVYMGHKINNIRLVLCVWRVCFYFGNIEPHPSTVSDRYDNSPTRRTTSWLEEIRKYNGGGGGNSRELEKWFDKRNHLHIILLEFDFVKCLHSWFTIFKEEELLERKGQQGTQKNKTGIMLLFGSKNWNRKDVQWDTLVVTILVF